MRKKLTILLKAILIWLSTNLIGAAIVFMMNPQIRFEGLTFGFVITSAYSAPAILILFLLLYFIQRISKPITRTILALVTILITCFGITAFFIQSDFAFRVQNELVLLIAPYFVSSQLSYFLVYRPEVDYVHHR